MNPLTLIPPKVRRWVYLVYSVLGVAVGAVQVGYASLPGPQPPWLTVVLSVFAYLGVALGITAASNTPASRQERLANRL